MRPSVSRQPSGRAPPAKVLAGGSPQAGRAPPAKVLAGGSPQLGSDELVRRAQIAEKQVAEMGRRIAELETGETDPGPGTQGLPKRISCLEGQVQALEEDLEKTRILLREEQLSFSKLLQSKHDSDAILESRLNEALSINPEAEAAAAAASPPRTERAQLLLVQENQVLQNELADWKAAYDNLTARLQAETKTIASLQKKVENSERSSTLLDQQLLHLQGIYGESKDTCHRLSIQLAASEASASKFRSELSRSKDQVLELESSLHAASETHMLAKQLDSIHSQFSDMRKHMIQRDLDDESGVNAQRSHFEREMQGRLVYEKIINGLRSDIDDSSSKLQEAGFQLEKALDRCLRLEQLESEIDVYKDAAKRAVEETQHLYAAMAASSEEKIVGENQWEALTRQLNALKNEIQTAQTEARRYNQELDAEKKKSRASAMEVLGLERKIAELSSLKVQAELTVADGRRKKATDAYEIENLKRSLQEATTISQGLRDKLESVGGVATENDCLRQELQSLKGTLSQREEELQCELIAAKEAEHSLRLEVQSLQGNVVTLKDVHESSVAEIERLHTDYNALRSEREHCAKTSIQDERKRAELQVSALRSDLETTLASLKNAESLRQSEASKIGVISTCLQKERERTQVLTAELEAADETIHRLEQSLAVYTNLDIHNSSFNKQLAMVRSKDEGLRSVDRTNAAGASILERARRKLLSKVNNNM